MTGRLRVLAAATAGACSLALAVAPANASVTLGETFVPTENCGSYVSTFMRASPALPAVQYAAPTAGVITSWSFQTAADAPDFMRLKTFRPSADKFQTVGRGPLERLPEGSALSTFMSRVPVQAGDLIGYYSEEPGNNYLCGREAAGYDSAYRTGDTMIGSVDTYVTNSADAGSQKPIAAVLEPDGDGDGFGDETQDVCPTDPRLQIVACDAPPPGGSGGGGGSAATGQRSTALEKCLKTKTRKARRKCAARAKRLPL